MSSMSLNMMSFSPRQLFNGGEQGAWYDPSDMSTMFQNSAGTTPVTAVEQPVGLLLDKSKGLVLGAEIAVNGSFASGTGWGTQTGWAISGGTANATAASGYLFQANGSVVVNRYYEVTFTVSNYVSGSVRAYFGGTPIFGTAVSANGTYTQRFSPTINGGELGLLSSAFTGSIDNVSVKEVAGNHASQATDASRPVLSAKVNQLTYTEQFDNGVWTPRVGNATRTANTLTPTTTNGTHYVGITGVATVAGAQYVWSCSFKPNGYNYVSLYFYDITTVKATSKSFRIDTGTIVSQVEPDEGITSTATISGPDVDGYYRCAITTAAVPGGSAIFDIRLYNNVPAVVYVGDGVSGVYATKADLRVANDGVGLPAYQRVAAATDYDTSGFPLYLKFDGTDDSLATGSIDFTATDKMSVFAGHRIVSGTGSQLIYELGTNSYESSGFAFAQGPVAATAGLGFLMNAGSGIGAQTADKSVPYTSVSSLLLNSAQSGVSNEGILRSNTTLQTYTATAGTDSGTANFPNKILYIGNRSGNAVWFNGRLYSLIVRGAASTTGQITDTEGWINSRTRAY